MASSFIEARDVVCGFDVGKSFHHAFAMERATGEVYRFFGHPMER